MFAIFIILGLAFLWRALFFLKFPTSVENGVTFSQKQAEDLGLDWRQTYSAILDELQVKNLRLVAYWDLVEPQKNIFDFNSLDWQMDEAEERGAKVILVVGSRVPRWPECHAPNWTFNLPENEKEEALLNYLQAVVVRYQNSPALEIWQVENEHFLKIFGECPGRNKPLLTKELELVKKLDPAHPTMVTDSGELATWLRTRNLADYLGTSVYRVVYTGIGYVNYRNIIPAAYYRLKALVIRKPVDKIIVSEFQAEPWTTQDLVATPLNEQQKTMDYARFDENIIFSRELGFKEVYWWGVEWWYWKKLQGDSYFWETAKPLF